MAKKIISLIILFIIIYFQFSTFESGKDIVGNVGSIFSNYSHKYFGYLSYVYLLLFIYPLYIINFKENIKQKDLILNITVVFLLLFVSLIFQALIIENPYNRGEIGNILVDTLSPIIGRAGLYFFVLVGFIISSLVLFENSDLELKDLKVLKNKIKLRNNIDIKRIENKRREKRAEESKELIETKAVKNSIIIENNKDGKYIKIYQNGNVTVGNDVEIG
uniref:DNA translocase FtsK 4TM domain-containing protein n=1 Tax=Aliarcobacter sp. TaxID=2321116 RepID=UPI004047290A